MYAQRIWVDLAGNSKILEEDVAIDDGDTMSFTLTADDWNG